MLRRYDEGVSSSTGDRSAEETPSGTDARGTTPTESVAADAGYAAGLLRQARKAVVLVVGGTVVLIGVAMLVLPGPAFIVIPAGIAILATEFVWARRLLRKVKARIRLAAKKARQRAAASPSERGNA